VNTLLLFFQAASQASGFPAATHEYHLEELFDYCYVQPKQSEEKRKKLEDKLKEAVKPPLKKAMNVVI